MGGFLGRVCGVRCQTIDLNFPIVPVCTWTTILCVPDTVFCV